MRGYFGIGVYHPKTSVNIGTLWRHAYIYNAAFIFVIGKRYSQQCSDTLKVPRHIPLWQFKTWEDFKAAPLYDCPLVAVELTDNAVSLDRFIHPQRAIYLLGAEDNGLPSTILSQAVHTVSIPSGKLISMNVATAGTLVMYDRFTKE